MNGVAILNEIEYVTTISGEFNDNVAAIALLATVIICALIGFFIGRVNFLEFDCIVLGALVGFALGLFIGIFFGSLFSGPAQTKTTTRYEVTIDDSVSMNEFTDKYNIIEQRGQIWIVEEKEE